MARALAFTQFIIISLGAVALHLLVRLDHPDQYPGFVARISVFIAHHALWLMAVPILWAVSANAMKSRAPDAIINRLGIVLTLMVLAFISLPLFYYLS